ncbi:Thiolase, N-terminal domain-containing protein [Mycena floridula]|nr:Thiolase, N-terminal domain-containing protein [Mycena floridula]
MFTKSSGRAKLLQQNDDDVVICAAVRTPLTKARKGGLAKTSTDIMLTAVLKEVVARSKVDPALVEEVIVGNVLSPGGGGAGIARMAAIAAGLPVTTSVAATNRQCSSGLTSVAMVASFIQNGTIDIGIGNGVESMTFYHGSGGFRIGTDGLNDIAEETLANQDAVDCMIPMGITSENVAADFGITRLQQDQFSADSTAKASAAQKAGYFKSEIVPMKLADGRVIDSDDGIRAGTTVEVLSKLKPAFSDEGSTTAGNASQVTDGAAAVLLARRSKAKELGLPIIGKFGAFAIAGVPPRIMGIGPAYAIPKLFGKLGLTNEDVDFFEINEAFASQAVYCVQKLGIPMEKVNPNGGAIAFGHPLGATGARQIATGYAHGARTGQKVFVTSMCIGTGMGAAAAFVVEG